MPRVYLSLGSNVEPRHYLKCAVDELRRQFGVVVLSPVYESVAVGFEGDNFLNLVAAVDTRLAVGELARRMRDIEEQNDRRRDVPRFSSRSLDIDILTYGDALGEIDGLRLPRAEITEYAFVIRPLADIAGDECYPANGLRYRQICQQLVKDDSELWPVKLAL